MSVKRPARNPWAIAALVFAIVTIGLSLFDFGMPTPLIHGLASKGIDLDGALMKYAGAVMLAAVGGASLAAWGILCGVEWRRRRTTRRPAHTGK